MVSQRNGVWRRAVEVPGIGFVSSVSCGSAGNCAAVGGLFVVSQRNGVWHRAVEVPGLAALNRAGGAEVRSVSCASAGNCAAGGYYQDRSGHWQGFVVSQRNGAWRRAVEVPGLAALNAGGFAAVYSVSCGPAGNCAAGGYYHDRSGHAHGFVVSQRHGVWLRAVEVPGLAALSAGGQARVFSVSCGPAGSCAAGGYYLDRRHQAQGFVVSQRNGVWRRAIEVPGLAALNRAGDAEVNSVSCASAGNCAAGGDYQATSGEVQRGFVVSQRNGVWGRAIEVPGLAALGGFAFLNSVSCGSAGNCAAGGDDADDGGPARGFVVSQRHGVWRKAIEVPALAALSGPGYAEVNSVSCAPAGNCAAGGYYLDRHGSVLGFVVSQRNGLWGRAIEVPGLM